MVDFITDDEMSSFKDIYDKIKELLETKFDKHRIVGFGFAFSESVLSVIINDRYDNNEIIHIPIEQIGIEAWKERSAKALAERRALFLKLKEEFEN
ncbi:MAG: hypothetical protein PHT13_00410 [Methanosarcina sp.]|nr:hypothetical protein [Methanosarcina sp.]